MKIDATITLTKEKEVLCLTALQYRMLELVLEIDAICKKHNIVYYLAGGSILGAVRHKGFIPWDDDIDIMMTRQEFAKFQKICETDMAEDREIITMVNTPCHTKVTIKYMNKSTSQFFRSQVLDTTGCGISLDIMILDPLPRDEKEKQQHIAEYIVYNELLTPFFMVNEYLYKHVPMYERLYRQAEREGKKRVMDTLYQHLFVDEPEQSDLYLYRWGQQLLIYEQRLMGTPKYLPFEGHMLPVPEKTIDFLRATYGDNWIYLPSEQNRETHTSNLSTNIAYRNWLRDMDQFLDRPKALKHFVKRKKLRVQNAVPAHELEMSNYRQQAILKQLEFETVECYGYDTLSRMDDRRLIRHVGNYLSVQLSSGFFKNQVYIDIPDETLVLILNALIRVGDYPKADKILKLRRTVSRELTQEMIRAQELIDSVRATVSYFENRRLYANEVQDIHEMAPAVLQLQRENPRQVNLHRCVLEMYTLLKETSDEGALSAIDQAMACYPEDMEIAFWAGCLYAGMGKADDAAAQFEKAKFTNNGMILQRLKEMEGKEND